MKSEISILKLFVLSLVTILTTSCSGYFDNPLKDKETGEDIELLVIDESVFPVRLQIFLNDSSTGAAIVHPATISFSGKNYDDIITLSGKKKSGFYTSSGFLELAIDPNVSVSENNPLSFTIHVNTASYPGYSKEYHFYTTGIKELKLAL